LKPILTLTTYSQLKALSDPLRAEMIMRLLENPYTGQQLSEHFQIPRGKIHYHLKELEKNGLIEIVRTEEKNGIIQKFYQSVARGFTPSAELLPFKEELSETSRQILLQMSERTKIQILSAPDEAFMLNQASEDPSEWNFLASLWQFSATEEQFNIWLKKFFVLMDELKEITEGADENPESKLYYLSAMGFQIEEPFMKSFQKVAKKDQ
jgi:DNA-binding transcriptional ArsR family regulator